LDDVYFYREIGFIKSNIFEKLVEGGNKIDGNSENKFYLFII